MLINSLRDEDAFIDHAASSDSRLEKNHFDFNRKEIASNDETKKNAVGKLSISNESHC
jgi:hypothetical protein